MSAAPPRGTIRNAIVELAARPGGVSARELKADLEMAEGNVPPNMQALEDQGRVLRAKADGQNLRWFKHAEHRDAWLTAAKAARSTAQQVEAAKAKVRRAPDSLPGSVYTAGASKIAPRIKGDPIITADTIITEVPCRAFCARWQAQPSQPTPGFSTLGIGRYL